MYLEGRFPASPRCTEGRVWRDLSWSWSSWGWHIQSTDSPVGTGHLLEGIPHFSGSFQEGGNLGQEEQSRLRWTWLCPAHVSLSHSFFSGIQSHPTPPLFTGNKSTWLPFNPGSLLFLLWGAPWKGPWLERWDPNSCHSWVCQHPSVHKEPGSFFVPCAPVSLWNYLVSSFIWKNVCHKRANKGMLMHNG